MTAVLRTGVSNAAETLRRVREDENQRSDETVTFSNYPLNDQLIDVFLRCSESDWDGEGSEPVDRSTLLLAKQLVESLPWAYRTPTISGEPDGHVSLEWYVDPRRVLAVSVSPNGLLYWSALIGEEDPRGSCRFYGDTLKTLLYWIGRVCTDD